MHALCKFSNLHTWSHLPSKQKALESTIQSALTIFQSGLPAVNVPWRKLKIFSGVIFIESVFRFFNLNNLFTLIFVKLVVSTKPVAGCYPHKTTLYSKAITIVNSNFFFYSNLNPIITLCSCWDSVHSSIIRSVSVHLTRHIMPVQAGGRVLPILAPLMWVFWGVFCEKGPHEPNIMYMCLITRLCVDQMNLKDQRQVGESAGILTLINL